AQLPPCFRPPAAPEPRVRKPPEGTPRAGTGNAKRRETRRRVRRREAGGEYPRSDLSDALGQIDAARMERVAPQQPAGRERNAPSEPVLEDRQAGVLRAGRRETARTGEKRRNPPLVEAQEGEREAGHRSPPRGKSPRQSRSRSSAKRAPAALDASGLRWTTKSTAGISPRRSQRRKASRILRFSRCRKTALPT